MAHLVIDAEVFPGSSLPSADVLVQLKQPVSPPVDPRAGPSVPVGEDAEVTMDTGSRHQVNLLSDRFQYLFAAAMNRPSEGMEKTSTSKVSELVYRSW